VNSLGFEEDIKWPVTWSEVCGFGYLHSYSAEHNFFKLSQNS